MRSTNFAFIIITTTYNSLSFMCKIVYSSLFLLLLEYRATTKCTVARLFHYKKGFSPKLVLSQ